MDTEYVMEELKSLLVSHFNECGFQVEEDKIINPEIPWRPPVYARKNESEIAVDVRLSNTITEFWLKTYRDTYEKCPNIDIFVAIPEDIGIPYQLGKKLESDNIGIILVSYEEINYLLKPRSPVERETTKAIRRKLDARIDKATYEDLEPYIKEIRDAVNIFEIGCHRDAIGAIGRVLETAIDNFLIEANRKHKIAISKKRREGMDFHTKINFLHSNNNAGRKKQRNISESEKSKMLSVKWDRNIGDHPADDEEIKQMIRDSRAILELGISMTRLMKTKREDLYILECSGSLK